MEFIMAVALWCSIPVNATQSKLAFGLKTGSDRTLEDVQQCRDRLIKCYSELKLQLKLDSIECFHKEKLR